MKSIVQAYCRNSLKVEGNVSRGTYNSFFEKMYTSGIMLYGGYVMAYQTLYRKYRPKSFELVYGQDTIVKTLKNVIKEDKLSHAYLFTGPRGTGKTSCAKLFAKAINCSNNKNGDACNDCKLCKSFNENSNPDIIEIDAASNNGVDEIREIRNKISLVPSISKYKVYIIDEVHMLSIGAFNALLKTLEEPPNYVIFILATTEPQKLPATVISRCQRFDFKSISYNHMKACLENIVKNENILIEDEALDEIVNNSKGGLRDAIGLLDQAYAFSESKITLADIDELSGNISDEELCDILNFIINADFKSIFKLTEEMSKRGKDFYLISEKLLNFARNAIIFKKTNVENVKNNEIIELINLFSIEQLYEMTDVILNMMPEIQRSYHKKTIFEVKLLQLIDNIFKQTSRKDNLDAQLLESEKFIIFEQSKDNVPRETSEQVRQIDNNVPRETFKIEEPKNKYLNELKNIRINNILKGSTKKEINFILELWNNIKDYLLDSKYKVCAGILSSSKPVAASKTGIIITVSTESSIDRIENNYDQSKELIKEVLGASYKLVYITEDNWKKIRPEYVLKAKNNKLELIDEDTYLSKMKQGELEKTNSTKDFNDLIVMEEK